jgi:hypothetical protein
LTLSAFTHIWNPVGFPAMYDDEDTYLKRAVLLLNGQGPNDPDYGYDHPYFGQVFLAGVLKLIGYTDSLDSTTVGSYTNVEHSIELLYLFPRILMGILAVVDTFLVYKISERRYGRNVAFIASILFAVMPMTWLLRRIVLDSIQQPLLLSSILFAVYYNSSTHSYLKISNNKVILTILLSGIFLGLSIFTKAPAFTMIPLVAFLIYTNKTNKKSSKILGLWLIPVVMIPLIWPIYALSIGEFNIWLQDVHNQSMRHEDPLFFSIMSLFRIDPLLLIIGIAGIVFFVAMKRDFMLFLWVVPYLIFLYFIGVVIIFHFIPMLAPFCIAAARLITYLSSKFPKKYIQQRITKYFSPSDFSHGKFHSLIIVVDRTKDILLRLFLPSKLPFTIISVIGIFGLISTIMLITMNLNSSYFDVYAFVVKNVVNSSNNNNDYQNKVSLLGDNRYVWIPNYVFHMNHFYHDVGFESFGVVPINTKKFILVVDEGSKLHFEREWRKIYNSTLPIAQIKRNMDAFDQLNHYPYTSLAHNYFHKATLFFPVNTEIRSNLISLNSSVYVIQLSNGSILADINHRLEKVAAANQTRALPLYWNDSRLNCNVYFECVVNSTTGWKDRVSFQISTKSVRELWSWIYSKEIGVNPNERYELVTHMKLNKFVIGSHVALQGYNEISKDWYPLTTQCPPGTNGPLEWKEFRCNMTIPANTTKIKLLLNAGWSSEEGKEAVTLFDAIYLSKEYTNTASHMNGQAGNVIYNPEFVYLDNVLSNLCQLEEDSGVQLNYKLVNLTERNEHKLSMIAHCSRIY